MNTMTRNAVNSYEQTSASASPHQLILMLFDGAVIAVARARTAMLKKDIPTKCREINHAIVIIQEGLQLSLDVKSGGEIAVNLNALYEYMCLRLTAANLKNQVEMLDEVGRLLVDLRKSWASIVEKPDQPKAVALSADQPVPMRNTAISYGKA